MRIDVRGMLVDPEGRAVEVPFAGDFAVVGGRVLESVVNSTIRARITDGVLRRYCVVVMLEGTEADENRRVRQVVDESFRAIQRVFDRMPKAVGDLPELIVIPREQRRAERVLLWSLNLAENGADEENGDDGRPSLAVVFGRGRRFGPILHGPGITEATLLGILGKAGQSCECDLDRSWMRGPRIPLRWDADVKHKAVELLGFDPENPLVKSEISGILARGPNAKGGREGREPSIADLLGGYSEEVVAVDAATRSDTGIEASTDRTTDQPTAEGDETGRSTEGPQSLFLVLGTFGSLLVLSLVLAGVVLLRSRRP